jgi:hypothetical protein
MTGTYKEFYKFINIFAPHCVDIWEDLHNRKDPKSGDKFRITWPYKLTDVEMSVMHTIPMVDCTFVKVEFDPEFKNGVAFYYIFDNNGEELKLHSINDVYDTSKLTESDFWDLFAFWTHCKPID